MNALFKIVAAGVCGLLFGLPAAQADEYWPMTDVFIHFGTADNKLRVTPDKLLVQVGEIYRVVVINPSDEPHIVAAPEFAGKVLTTDLLSGTPTVDHPTQSIYKGIMVQPGQMLEWTFMPIETGQYKFGCTIPFHAEADMYVMIESVDEVFF